MIRVLRSVLALALVAAVGVVPAGSGAAAAGSLPGAGLVPGPVSKIQVVRSDGTLVASWPSVDGAVSYHVTYSSDGGASWSLAALDHPASPIVGAGVVSIRIDGVDNAATYLVGVRARGKRGDSGWRNSSPVGPYVAPPGVPSGLAAAAGDGSVTLSWDDPSDQSVRGYEWRMRYAGVAWGEWALVPGGGTATSHVVDGLDNGTEYRFKVRARGAGGHSKPAPTRAPWYVAAVPNEVTTSLTVVNPTPGVASMTLGGYSGQWYYQAQGHIPPDEGEGGAAGAAGGSGGSGAGQPPECVGPAEGGQAQVTGLNNKADYVFGAYSDGACTAEIASASSQGSVARPGGVFEQFLGRTDGTLRVLWTASGTSGVVYDVVYSSDGGQSWTRAATGIAGSACPADQLGGRTSGLCYTITGAVGGSGNRMDNTATYIVGVRATKGGVSSWWRNSSALDPLPEPRVIAYVVACPNTTDYVLYMSWAKLPEAGITEQVRYKIGNGAWVNLPAEDSNTPEHRKIRGSGQPGSRWLEWMEQLSAASPSYSVTAEVRRTGTLGTDTIQSSWGSHTFNAGTSSDVKRWYTRCPAAPTRFVQTASTATSVTLTWNAVLDGPNIYDIQYQEQGTTAWTDAATAHETTSYTITGLTTGKNYRAQVRARYRESSAASGWTTLDFTAGVDYDTDNDRLIEIKTLAQLNAIRYDTDGNGQVASNNQANYNTAFPNAADRTTTKAMGCPNTCQGYELAADLDFDEDGDGVRDDTYNTGSGWDPVASYNTTLKGNNHTINNLYINRGYTNSGSTAKVYVGLFGQLGGSARVSGFALDAVDVYVAATASSQAATPWVGALAGRLNTGARVSGISVSGRIRTWRNLVNGGYAIAGGLTGENKGAVSGVASTAYVEARMDAGTTGGDAGGIAGHNSGTIAESWFSGHAKGDGGNNARVGGIAGVSTGGSIKVSYSTGTVEATTQVPGTSRLSAGIVGNLTGGTVQAVYAAGSVTGDANKGGVTATSSGGTVTDAYYDSTAMGTLSGGRGTAKTTTELQTPTAYGTGNNDIYKDWNLNLDGVTGGDDPWDFGTNSDYPILKSAPAGLTATGITSTTATLAIHNHNAAWWYKGDQTGATCTAVTAGTTTASPTLTADTTYTYTAYSDSSCTAKLAASDTFTTAPGNPQNVSVGNSTNNGTHRVYPVRWQKPANTQASDRYSYEVQCTNQGSGNQNPPWTACGTKTKAATASTDLTQNVEHGITGGLFYRVRVRTVKDGAHSSWVIANTQYGPG